MRGGIIAGAGPGTQEVEQPAPNSPIWELDNIFLAPYIGWRRLETR